MNNRPKLITKRPSIAKTRLQRAGFDPFAQILETRLSITILLNYFSRIIIANFKDKNHWYFNFDSVVLMIPPQAFYDSPDDDNSYYSYYYINEYPYFW